MTTKPLWKLPDVQFLGRGTFGSVVGVQFKDGPRFALKFVLFEDAHLTRIPRALPFTLLKPNQHEKLTRRSRIEENPNSDRWDAIAECVAGRLMTSLGSSTGAMAYYGECVCPGTLFHDYIQRGQVRVDLAETTLMGRITACILRVRDVLDLISPASNELWLVMAMEWLPGDSFSKCSTLLSVPSIRLVAYQLLWSALAGFEAFGVAHRDISRANVFLLRRDTNATVSRAFALNAESVYRADIPAELQVKLVDYGSATYYATRFDTRGFQLAQAQHWADVHPLTRDLTTVPSPDLIFFSRAWYRTAWSDAYALGMFLFEAMVGGEWHLDGYAHHLKQLLNAARIELRHEHYYLALVKMLFLLAALGQSDPTTGLPVDSEAMPLRETRLYAFLTTDAKFTTFWKETRCRNPAEEYVHTIRQQAGGEMCLAFFRTVLTWTPPPEAADNPWGRLVVHPFFDAFKVSSNKRKDTEDSIYRVTLRHRPVDDQRPGVTRIPSDSRLAERIVHVAENEVARSMLVRETNLEKFVHAIAWQRTTMTSAMAIPEPAISPIPAVKRPRHLAASTSFTLPEEEENDDPIKTDKLSILAQVASTEKSRLWAEDEDLGGIVTPSRGMMFH